jgi:hypothetical protein
MCNSTVTIANQPGLLPRFLSVPCGKCQECLQRRAEQWIFRIEQQMKVSVSAHFVTLTYSDQNIPITECIHNDQPLYLPTLVRKDFQNFMKRLRKMQPTITIKYYMCGEYGGRTGRPHYHAIILNSDIEKIHAAWRKSEVTGVDGQGIPIRTYTQIGMVNRGEVTPASIAYTVKYMQKGSWLKSGKYGNLDVDTREKEFSLMSKEWG